MRLILPFLLVAFTQFCASDAPFPVLEAVALSFPLKLGPPAEELPANELVAGGGDGETSPSSRTRSALGAALAPLCFALLLEADGPAALVMLFFPLRSSEWPLRDRVELDAPLPRELLPRGL